MTCCTVEFMKCFFFFHVRQHLSFLSSLLTHKLVNNLKSNSLIITLPIITTCLSLVCLIFLEESFGVMVIVINKW